MFEAFLFILMEEIFTSVNKPNKTGLMAVSQWKPGQEWIQRRPDHWAWSKIIMSFCIYHV